MENQCSDHELILYYYIDYEAYDKLPRRPAALPCRVAPRNPCEGISDEGLKNTEYSFGGPQYGRQRQLRHLDAEGPRPLRRLPFEHP